MGCSSEGVVSHPLGVSKGSILEGQGQLLTGRRIWSCRSRAGTVVPMSTPPPTLERGTFLPETRGLRALGLCVSSLCPKRKMGLGMAQSRCSPIPTEDRTMTAGNMNLQQHGPSLAPAQTVLQEVTRWWGQGSFLRHLPLHFPN